MILTEQLRECAKTKSDVFNPHWEDHAKMLMLWAADTIDAADTAVLDNHYKENKHKDNK